MSKQQAMKSMNWISHTGRMPMYDAPIAEPTIAGSGDRRVDDALLAEVSMQSLGHLERAAVDADVLADEEHALVARHLVEERLANRFEIR